MIYSTLFINFKGEFIPERLNHVCVRTCVLLLHLFLWILVLIIIGDRFKAVLHKIFGNKGTKGK